jgi:hypothetical protein
VVISSSGAREQKVAWERAWVPHLHRIAAIAPHHYQWVLLDLGSAREAVDGGDLL